ncbi:MAG: AbgT family transporter [Oscillospiraceae bacterium]|nr:AbgT family transporter [Oscillospiraceae bacterium]
MEEENKSVGSLHFSKKTLIFIGAVLAGALFLAGLLTQVIPRGAYDTDAAGNIINGTYHLLDGQKMPFWRVFTAPIEIFTSGEAAAGIGIIAFIVLIGGTFLVLDKAGVIACILSVITKRFAAKKYTLLALVTLLFMALSSVAGILEESVTIVPLAAATAVALGWDSLTGLGFSLVAVAMGYSAATFNPFNVGIVQTLAGLPMFSGLLYRLVVFAVFYGIVLAFLTLYAKKVEKNPRKSLCYASDEELREKIRSGGVAGIESLKLRRAAKVFCLCVAGVPAAAVVGLGLQQITAIPEGIRSVLGYLPTLAMAVLFTVGGLRAGRIAGLTAKEVALVFWQGVKTIAPTIPLMLLVLSVTYIIKHGMILDTLLHAAYGLAEGTTAFAALLIILAVVVVLEFFIGSGSAKAFLLMPLLLPLADLLGITRQSVALAFSLGDGICNILYPTSGIMIIAIGLINVSYGKFLRWSWKLFLALFATAALLLWVAVRIGYN